jgi:hypothetical protein
MTPPPVRHLALPARSLKRQVSLVALPQIRTVPAIFFGIPAVIVVVIAIVETDHHRRLRERRRGKQCRSTNGCCQCNRTKCSANHDRPPAYGSGKKLAMAKVEEFSRLSQPGLLDDL